MKRRSRDSLQPFLYLQNNYCTSPILLRIRKPSSERIDFRYCFGSMPSRFILLLSTVQGTLHGAVKACRKARRRLQRQQLEQSRPQCQRQFPDCPPVPFVIVCVTFETKGGITVTCWTCAGTLILHLAQTRFRGRGP